MITTIAEKVLAVVLGVCIVGGAGILWYADHERARADMATLAATRASEKAAQAVADRDVAARAASDAAAALVSADKATRAAQAAASSAQAAAATARGKLAEVAKAPDTAKVLNTEVPTAVWDAIYNRPTKGE